MIKVFLALTLVAVLLLSGCAGPPAAGEDEGSALAIAATQAASAISGLSLTISPIEGNTVSGIVTLTVVNVPENTQVVAFIIAGPGTEESPPIGMDIDGSNGWTYILDTTVYENGVYSLSAVTGETLEDDGPTGITTTQIIIEN